ncbi:MarR family winged helix-turn-helix transcriptional regulator [Paenibacillus kobensis]|uniref:MarR family winged helix-turn-helix transcriptional regulator n=1 Tax=Paenibacillus kobensis TaxID=59841 RepID=UPI000FDB9C5C|nr:MarR family transcriptional regulator [Paenibacillus kobensis]
MDQKKALFYEMVSFITSVHQTMYVMTKELPLGDVTPVQYGILEYIAVSQPVTLSEISDCKHISMPNTSRELKKLTDKGMCEKAEAEDDKRKQYIRLSSKGQQFMDAAFAHMEREFLGRIGSADGEELEQMRRAMVLLRTKVFDTDGAI